MVFIRYQHVERIDAEEAEGLLDGVCHIFPKMDGSNMCAYSEDGEVRTMSRNKEIHPPEPFAEFIKGNKGVRRFLADFPGLRLYFLGFLFAGANIVKSGFYSATGRGRESSILALCRGVVAIVAFAFLLSHLFGITGVWLAFPAAELFTLLLGLVLGRPQGLGAPDPRPA